MKHLATIATTIACMGGFIFGFDIGVISGVLAMPTFPQFFGIVGSAAEIATVKGNVVSVLQAGCCAGALLINFMADPVGRKWTIVFSSLIFIVGSILQAVAINLPMMMAGRFFGGFGVGASSMLVPMYVAEIAPRRLRGRLGTLWQFLIVLGIMVSYWIDYGCLRNLPTGNNQWRIPLAIQIAPGAILCFGMIICPESLRWLALKGRHEDLKRNLIKLRDLPEDHPDIAAELEEINAAVTLELESKQGKWTDLIQPSNFHRLFIGIMLQIFQQWTGSNAINYYAPEIFKSIGLSSNETDILATGVYGIVKVVFVFVTFFIIDTKLGRRRTLMMGSVVMMIAFYLLGGMIVGIQKDNGGSLPTSGTAEVGAKGYVAMVSIYLFAVGYEFSWGPVPWIVCSEIFSTSTRAKSLSITTAFNWAMNATIAKVTPIMLANITYGTYFFFGTMAIVMGVFTFFLLPETRGRSLEEMNELFTKGDIWAHKDTYVIDNEQMKRDEETGDFKE